MLMSSTLTHCPAVASPFDMLIDPLALQRALEGSQRLESLNRRICRPLDRQMPDKTEADERTPPTRLHDD
jgi:hypothetical protein